MFCQKKVKKEIRKKQIVRLTVSLKMFIDTLHNKNWIVSIVQSSVSFFIAGLAYKMSGHIQVPGDLIQQSSHYAGKAGKDGGKRYQNLSYLLWSLWLLCVAEGVQISTPKKC